MYREKYTARPFRPNGAKTMETTCENCKYCWKVRNAKYLCRFDPPGPKHPIVDPESFCHNWTPKQEN